ncbi:hypothetical protein [Bradyrhizobium vignae]|uniref:hypothetical protein n=1 Tax=Bradyrhizobium vignae TaxID=1549949 RepID=UPI00100BD53E|nr:hypothetical protein [Bradyrhizobium vignae]RXG85621.1 hypothetical protein EAV90_34955 [Bradyrhizobium vignae]
MSDAEAPTKLCRYCQKPMPLQAIICTECSSWQNWRGLLNFSVPVLSLLLALATVIFSSGREFYQAITYKPKLDVLLTKLDINNEREPWKPGHLRVSIVNNESEDIILDVTIECTAKNLDKPTVPPFLFRAVRLYSKPDVPINDQRPLETGNYFVVKAKTQEAAEFGDVYWEGDVKAVAPVNFSRVHLSCRLPYFYRGERRVASAEETPFVYLPPRPQ